MRRLFSLTSNANGTKRKSALHHIVESQMFINVKSAYFNISDVHNLLFNLTNALPECIFSEFKLHLLTGLGNFVKPTQCLSSHVYKCRISRLCSADIFLATLWGNKWLISRPKRRCTYLDHWRVINNLFVYDGESWAQLKKVLSYSFRETLDGDSFVLKKELFHNFLKKNSESMFEYFFIDIEHFHTPFLFNCSLYRSLLAQKANWQSRSAQALCPGPLEPCAVGSWQLYMLAPHVALF